MTMSITISTDFLTFFFEPLCSCYDKKRACRIELDDMMSLSPYYNFKLIVKVVTVDYQLDSA